MNEFDTAIFRKLADFAQVLESRDFEIKRLKEKNKKLSEYVRKFHVSAGEARTIAENALYA